MKDKKKLFEMLIPAVLAVFVVVGFAISGHVTQKLDAENPTAVVTEKQTEESKEPDISSVLGSKVTLVAVGDNLIHNTLVDSGQNEDGSEDYSSFYAHLKQYISAADVAVINQETILGGSEFAYTGYPTFNTPWAVGTAAIDAGFDIFTCATNHSIDKGFKGIQQECLFFENHQEVSHVGTYSEEEASNSILYYEKNNITFAILNYTYGTNGIALPDGKEWCVNMMDKDRITADVKEAQKNADVVIVFPHWGTENSTVVSSYQIDYVNLFSELGVDIVIGTHPHVLQPVEWVENEETGKKMLVYYSLGNFISHQTSLDQLCGGIAEIKIEKNSNGISITSSKLIPTVTWYSETDGKYSFAVYKLADYTDELAASHKRYDKGATPQYFTNLAKDVVSDEFLSIE